MVVFVFYVVNTAAFATRYVVAYVEDREVYVHYIVYRRHRMCEMSGGGAM